VLGAVEDQLRDGTRVVIRPITPQDRAEIAAAVRHLSPESRYKRFLGGLDALDERTLRYLTEIDHHDHEALVAFDAADGHGVGVARYARTPGGSEAAELAVVVADAWQGQGLGTLLVRKVIDRARDEGIGRLTALVLATNAEMLDLLKREGWAREGLPHDGTVELSYTVPREVA
jgi:RimJ/RimL family protein N-acetyltransferase